MRKLILCLWFVMFPVYAADTPVGLVLDLQGKATIRNGAVQTPLNILTYLSDGSEISLDAGSKLTVTHYAQKNQQSFTGSVRLSIKADSIKVLEGNAGKSVSLTETQIAMSSKGLEGRQRQAALVMRGFGGGVVMLPANHTSVRTTTPEFSWTPFDGDPALKVVIFDDEGEAVYTAEAKGSRYPLPQEKALTKGKKYSWTVIRKETSASASSRKQQFMVLTDEQAQLVESQKPTDQSSFADKLLYAGLLENLWLRDEAKIYWQLLAKERPEDEILRKAAE